MDGGAIGRIEGKPHADPAADECEQCYAAGQAVLQLKTRWRAGMTQLVMSPLAFMQLPAEWPLGGGRSHGFYVSIGSGPADRAFRANAWPRPASRNSGSAPRRLLPGRVRQFGSPAANVATPWTGNDRVGAGNRCRTVVGASLVPIAGRQTDLTPTPGQGARCPSGSAAPAFTSPSEKLVWMSFTFGRFSSVSTEKRA